MLKHQQQAPLFSLPDQDGVLHSLSAYRGQWVILYFYPKDDTPGCTVEACGFRDGFSKFKRKNISILGVSADSIKKHKKFSLKFSLPFPLLSDEEKIVVNQYGVWGKKKFMGREYDGIFRTTFLIDPLGKIAAIYDQVKPENHADEILARIDEILLENE